MQILFDKSKAKKAGFNISEDEKYIIIESDINIRDEYFYEIKSGNIEIFDVPEYVSRLIRGQNNFNKENVDYFINNYVFPTGETGLDGVYRFLPNAKYLIDKKKSTLYLTKKEINQTNACINRERFDEVFCNVLKKSVSEYKSEEIGVLFSGGVDSIYIVISLLKIGVRPILFTAIPTPEFDSSNVDRIRSEYFGKKFGLTHHFVETHPNHKRIIQYWEDLKQRMPMATHTGIFFEDVIKLCKRENIKIIITGQNADTFYNLGPTSKPSMQISDIADTFRRFYLTSFIIRGLERKEKTLSSYIRWAISSLLLRAGSKIYQLLKKNGVGYRAPLSTQEAYHAYINTPDYTIFPSKKQCSVENNNAEFDFYAEIIKYKVHNFLTSGAPMIIHNTAYNNGIESIAPYSDAEMLEVFASLDRNLSDVIHPKKFIYSSIEAAYPTLLNELSSLAFDSDLPDYHSWLKNTMFHYENLADVNKYNIAQAFMRGLSRSWLDYSKLKSD